MIQKVVAFALDQPLFLALMTVLFIAAGVLAFLSLPIEAFPDVSDIQVNVITLYPGRAAEEVEKQVTIPIEISLAGLPHNVRMFSHTQFGLSFLMLTFDDEVNDYFARQQVLERLQTADRPNGVQPQLAPLSTPIGELYRYRLRGDGLTPTDLRSIQDWTVARYLKMTPGVADVVSLGGLIKQYEVNPDPARLRYYHLTLLQLFAALGRGNANGGGGSVGQGSQQYLIRGIGLLRSAQDIGNIVVAARGGTPILVKDLCHVTLSAVPRQGVVGQDRDDDIVTGIVLMRKGENPSRVLRGIKERVTQLNASILPRGVQVVPFYDRTWLIDTTLKTVFQNLLEGATLVSAVLSLTLVPLLCYALLRAPLPHEENQLVRACRRGYTPVLRWALGAPWRVLGIAVLALGASLASFPRLGTEFLPELNEGTVWINLNLPPGVSVTETVTQVARARAALARIPEVTTTVSKAGRPEDGTDPKPLNMVEIFVGLRPLSEWARGVTKEQVIQEMDHALAVIPGIEVSFSQPIRDNVLESISQIDGQVVIKVFGDDPALLRATVQQVLEHVAAVRGVARAFIDRAGEVPQARLEIDQARAARYGLNVADIEDQIEIGLGGKAATELWEGEKHFSVVARLAGTDRRLANIDRILIDTPDGQRIPLSEVADSRLGAGSMNISREAGRRVAAVSVFIRGRDMGSVVQDMQDRVKRIALPAGYNITWSGEFENQQRAMKRLIFIVPITVFLIFVLLFDAFKSLKHTLVILLNVPFALIGGIFALLVSGIPLSVSAAIGFIALFGQSVLNGVVMVTVFNQLREAGAHPAEAVLRGALMRMRTVLMTALLAMLGLLPMALSRGIGSETQKPLAVVIIGGLISATLLVLVVLPTLYLALAQREAVARVSES